MKRQTMDPIQGKLVHQLPMIVTLAYDLDLTHTIPCQKDLSEDNNFGERNIGPWLHVAPNFPKKHRQGLKMAPEVQDPKNC